MNGKQKFLTAAVFCAVASVGFVLPASAEETMTHDLDEVIVEADRDALPGGLVRSKARLGILGDKSVLDIPYSEMSLTQKTLELFDDRPMFCRTTLRYVPVPAHPCILIFLCAASI